MSLSPYDYPRNLAAYNYQRRIQNEIEQQYQWERVARSQGVIAAYGAEQQLQILSAPQQEEPNKVLLLLPPL